MGVQLWEESIALVEKNFDFACNKPEDVFLITATRLKGPLTQPYAGPYSLAASFLNLDERTSLHLKMSIEHVTEAPSHETHVFHV